MGAGEAGRCGSCRYRRWVQSGKGSRFLFCRRSETDPRFPKYPRLPVLRCAGYEAGDDPADRSAPPSNPRP
ncbi:MAG: hypothetical protein HYY54_04415 [candidate division NC10 bacterium]|nr:hypothetical protein [candidate division NC10 bacterium]MBI3002859.1 hypothetical protein [candidate division NC10 bacterium]